MARLSFLGATGTVTGSKFLLEHEDFKMLLDCGLFQGLKELRERNWAAPPVDPAELDLIVLTHAHLDHSGYLPVMVKRGYKGQVWATAATCDLCGILLPDSGYLQEEDARWANKRGFSRHRPALPLYTEEEARSSLGRLRPAPFRHWTQVHEDIRLRFIPAGHILGASFVEVRIRVGKKHEKTIVFSGDIGRPGRPILPDPSPLPACDHLLVESTYGDRDHPAEDPKDKLATIIRETVEEGGSIIIPAFAVGRTQAMLFLLRELQQEGRLATDVPIHVNSPMAIHTIRVFMQHTDAQDREMRAMVKKGEDPLGLRNVHLDATVEQSKALNSLRYPSILISASGMATGGRVLHLLRHRLPDHRTTVLFVGHQAVGTRGRHLQEGADEVRIHGESVRVRARIETLDGMSAHGDRNGILHWLRTAEKQPKVAHIVHGEPDAAAALAEKIAAETSVKPHVPSYLERVEI